MSQLNDNLTEILRQKNTYLLPENLKKDVTCLGVTGTYEGGSDIKPYIELEYIESTGTQWIDSEFVPDVASRIDIIAALTSLDAGNTYSGTGNEGKLFGMGSIDDESNRITCGPARSPIRFYAGVGAYNYTHNVDSENVFYNKMTWFVDLNTNTYGYGDTIYTGTSANNYSNTNNLTAYIFGRRGKGPNGFRVENTSYMLCYDVKCYSGNVLYRHFIPCKLKSNNEIGLWELVEDKFYGNDGTGAFIAGPVKDTSSESTMNIFVQTTEPTIKKGIWLQTDKTIENVTFEDDIVESETWYPDGTINDIPYEFYYGNTTSVGTDIYLFGSNYNSSTKRYNYKYDTLNNTYTRMTDVPVDTADIQCITLGTNIYLFGAGTNFTLAYKYDTLTDTYTQLTDIPYAFRSGGLALINTDIYLIGGNYLTDSSTKHKYIYKYDTLTDTYTYINTIPETYMFYNGGICSVGTNIYMFGNGTYQSPITNQMAYKYDVSTNIFTQLTNIPYNFQYAKSVNEGTNIYLFGSGVSDYSQYCYKYNTLTDTYQRLTDISRPFARGSIAKVNQKIYLFGGYVGSDYSYDKKVQCLQLNVIDIDTDNTVVINQGRLYNIGYQIELFTNNKCINNAKYSFADAWFYTTNDGLITDIPTYYGNGTQWINIKNPPEDNSSDEGEDQDI